MFQPPDENVPPGQGDIVLVALVHLLAASELPPGVQAEAVRPEPEDEVGNKILLWPEERPELETWAHVTYGHAVVLTHNCAIDKDLLRLQAFLQARGLDPALAERQAEFLLQIAPIRCVADLPEHQQQQPGGVGYLLMAEYPGCAPDEGPFVVDLTRTATVSNRIVDKRVAIATQAFKHKLQSALCRYYAARNIDVSQRLSELFKQTVVEVESLEPPEPLKDRAKLRVRLRFENGESMVLQADYRMTTAGEDVSTAPAIERRN